GEVAAGLRELTRARVRRRGPAGWPTTDAMRAERIVLDVDMRAALRNRVHLRNVSVDNYYLSIARTADGRVRILPDLKQAARESDARPDDKAAQRANEEK